MAQRGSGSAAAEHTTTLPPGRCPLDPFGPQRSGRGLRGGIWKGSQVCLLRGGPDHPHYYVRMGWFAQLPYRPLLAAIEP